MPYFQPQRSQKLSILDLGFLSSQRRIMENKLSIPPNSHRLDWAERLESLKAAAFGAIAATLVFSLLIQLNGWLVLPQFSVMAGLPTWGSGARLLASGAIAQLSGALFAITYRYIIRQDQNPHLRSGAVGAFGLVRGLAQVDMGLHANLPGPALALLVGESFVLFGGIQWLLEWAIANQWVRPFKG